MLFRLRRLIKLISTIGVLLSLFGCSPEKVTSEESKIENFDQVITDQFDTVGQITPAGVDAEPYIKDESEVALEETKVMAKEIKEEKKRLAEEKRKKEEAEAKRLAEEKAEQERLAKEKAQSQQTAQANQSNSSQSSKPASTSSNTQKTESKPAQTRTDGFNYKGHHYSLANFSGSGHVPQETNNVYKWTNKPSHYLIERISPAGRTIRQLGVGDQVVINGNSYTIKKVQSGIPNNTEAIGKIDSVSHKVSFQTCDLTQTNGLSDVTIWWAE